MREPSFDVDAVDRMMDRARADERAKVERETWQAAAAWLEAQVDNALDRYGGDLPDTIVIDLAARLRARAKAE